MTQPLRKISLAKLLVKAYSFWLKRKFYACGRGVYIHFPAVLNNPHKVKLGNHVLLSCHCWLNCIENSVNQVTLTIGDDCQIGRFAHINAYENVVIENDVLIAERVHISDCSHHFADPEVSILRQGASFTGKVLIRRGAWIGSGAVILPGVTIGRNAVVGANAVVTKDVPDNTIAVGVPAVIRAKGKSGRSDRDAV